MVKLLRHILLLLLLAYPTYGDIAPVTYEGYSILPKSTTQISMKRETVDIYCTASSTSQIRNPYRVVAVFYMENNTGKPIKMPIGFPVSHSLSYSLQHNPKTHYFSIKLDGKEVKNIQKQSEDNDITTINPGYSQFSWFFCDVQFKPGQTVIEVSYTTFPSLSRDYFMFDNLYYIFSTGNGWEGNIGHARLTVHFPTPLAKNQIMQDTTPGYRIVGKTITWEFRNFEPTEKDNWSLEWIPHTVYSDMVNYQAQIKRNPANPDFKIKLAQLYLSLLPNKGFFPKVYARRAYFGAREVEHLFKEVLTTAPTDAEAWNTYLSYYFKLHVKSYGPVYQASMLEIPEEQKKVIRTAHARCPKNPGIELWYKLINPELWEIPQKLGEITVSTGHKRWVVFYTDPSGSGYSPPLTAEAIDFLLTVYTLEKLTICMVNHMPGFTAQLELSPDRKITPQEKTTLLGILKKSKFHPNWYSRRLFQYNLTKGIYHKKNDFY